jgi:hypothetical protein
MARPDDCDSPAAIIRHDILRDPCHPRSLEGRGKLHLLVAALALAGLVLTGAAGLVPAACLALVSVAILLVGSPGGWTRWVPEESLYRPALEGLGHLHTPYPDPDGVVRYPFFGKPPTRPRAFHIHVAQAGSHHERRHLAVCDFLRAHPDQARGYERAKHSATARHPGDRPG